MDGVETAGGKAGGTAAVRGMRGRAAEQGLEEVTDGGSAQFRTVGAAGATETSWEASRCGVRGGIVYGKD